MPHWCWCWPTMTFALSERVNVVCKCTPGNFILHQVFPQLCYHNNFIASSESITIQLYIDTSPHVYKTYCTHQDQDETLPNIRFLSRGVVNAGTGYRSTKGFIHYAFFTDALFIDAFEGIQHAFTVSKGMAKSYHCSPFKKNGASITRWDYN